MRYQLALQFPFSGRVDYDWLIELEASLEESLAPSAFVDGHDAGSGEMNIFIHTDTPEETFGLSRTVVEERGGLDKMAAGYRPFEADDYVRLWPPGETAAFTVA